MDLNQNLQEKYPHLEVSVLKLSEVQRDNETKRIDSEFFKKEYLENEEALKSETIILDFIETKIGNIKSLKLNKGFNYLQISDINLNNGLEYSTTKVDFIEIPDRATYVLQNNDICISTVRPNRNAVALIQKPKRLIGTSGFCVLRLNKKVVLPEFLYIFCKTNFFITKMMRCNTASLYPAVLDSDIHGCKIPLFPMSFQLEIEKMVKDSHLALEQSKALYKEAENLLYESLGLDPKDPLQSILESSTHHKSTSIVSSNSTNYTIKTLEESFLKTGRLDAEYYQEKYELIESCIKNYRGGFCELKDIVVNYSGGFAFSSDEYLENGDLALIRINNIKNAILDMSNVVYLDNKAFSLSPKDKASKGDILISMSGSIGLSCVVRENLQAMVNQRILKISIKNFNEDVLALILNSVLCKLQFERIGTGGVQTNLANSDILNLFIPKIDIETQNQIASHIQKSFDLRAQAKALLTRAKESVEVAILAY